jgi:branched-subunit amino acid ABC-type transport system permease component
MTAEVLLQGIVSGLLMGLVYALIAAGLSLIFGLMEIVNFAHGEVLMVAMFTSYWAWALRRLDPLVSLPLTVCLLFVLGATSYYGLIRWILDAPMLAQIFATFGLAVFLRSAAQAVWDVDFLVSRARSRRAGSRSPGSSSACRSSWPARAPSPPSRGSTGSSAAPRPASRSRPPPRTARRPR